MNPDKTFDEAFDSLVIHAKEELEKILNKQFRIKMDRVYDKVWKWLGYTDGGESYKQALERFMKEEFKS